MPLISCPQPTVLPIKTSDDSVSEDYGVLKNDKNVLSSLKLRSQHMNWVLVLVLVLGTEVLVLVYLYLRHGYWYWYWYLRLKYWYLYWY